MNELILSHILEELNTLIMVLDDDGNVTYINESAERLLGYNQNDLLGNGWWQLTRSNMHQANYDRQILLEAVTDLKDLSFSRKVLSKDGSQRIIDWKIKKNGTSIVAIGNDVTVK